MGRDRTQQPEVRFGLTGSVSMTFSLDGPRSSLERMVKAMPETSEKVWDIDAAELPSPRKGLTACTQRQHSFDL
jgi:hypothetical protein